MSPSARQRLGKLFHKRDHRRDTNGSSSQDPSYEPPPSSAPSPVVATGPGAGDSEMRRRSSMRSLRDKLNNIGTRQSPKAASASGQSPTTDRNSPLAAHAAAFAAWQQYEGPETSDQSDPAVDLSRLSLGGGLNGSSASREASDGSPKVRRKPVQPDNARYGARHLTNGAPDRTIRLVNDRDRDVGSQPSRDFVDFDQGLHDPRSIRGSGSAALSGLRKSSLESRDSPVSPISTESDERAPSRKPDLYDLRTASNPKKAATATRQPPSEKKFQSRQRSIDDSVLHKALPKTPTDVSPVIGTEQGTGADRERQYLVKDSSQPIDLTGIVDLRDTVDTTVHETWAPAVTHETIVQDVHEVRQEVVTREIHNHDVYHRILPISDVEVLPARHFVPTSDGLVEIPESQLSPDKARYAQNLIKEAASKVTSGHSDLPTAPRRFTAREFKEKDGDYREGFNDEGWPRTETTWVHPPTLETGGAETGQTMPFHFHSDQTYTNGLRA